MITTIKEEYLNNLHKFVNQMNRLDLSSNEIQKMLIEATDWNSHCWEEHLLFIDLIGKAREYIELDRKVNSENYLYTSVEEKEIWGYLGRYFSKLQMDLRDNDFTLFDLN